MTRRSGFPPEPTSNVHHVTLHGLEARLRRVEEEVRRAIILANESKQASEDFHRIVTGAVDGQYKHIKGELAQLQAGTAEQNETLDEQNHTLSKQNATLDTQTEQLRTLDAKLDNVIRAVEQRENLENAEKAIMARYDARVRRIQSTAGVLAVVAATATWIVTHWPFR